MFEVKSLKTLAAAAGLALAFSVSGAAASTIVQMYGAQVGAPPAVDGDALRGEIECQYTCYGWWLGDDAEWLGSPPPPTAGDWNKDYDEGSFEGSAHMLRGPEPGADRSDYALFVGNILGIDPDDAIFQPVVKTEVGGAETHTFTTSARWFTLTLGTEPRLALFKNTAMNNEITYRGVSGTGAGLSHIVELGVIPLPAAGWLLLTALGGLGAAGLRRRRKEDA